MVGLYKLLLRPTQVVKTKEIGRGLPKVLGSSTDRHKNSPIYKKKKKVDHTIQ